MTTRWRALRENDGVWNIRSKGRFGSECVGGAEKKLRQFMNSIGPLAPSTYKVRGLQKGAATYFILSRVVSALLGGWGRMGLVEESGIKKRHYMTNFLKIPLSAYLSHSPASKWLCHSRGLFFIYLTDIIIISIIYVAACSWQLEGRCERFEKMQKILALCYISGILHCQIFISGINCRRVSFSI